MVEDNRMKKNWGLVNVGPKNVDLKKWWPILRAEKNVESKSSESNKEGAPLRAGLCF